MTRIRDTSIGWVIAGAVLVAVGLVADSLGLGGGEGVGLREAVAILSGAWLIAAGLWGSGPAVGAVPALCVWMALGLLCGALDYAKVSYHRYDGMLINMPTEGAWILPISYTALFVLLGSLCAMAGLALPRLRALPVIAFAPAALVLWTVVRWFEWLGEIAGLALVCGAAVSVARLAGSRPAAFVAVCRRSTAVMTVLVLVALAVIPLARGCSQREAMAGLPPPPEGATNVLLIVLDTVRADHVGCYGYHRPTTPTIDRLAAEGVLFDRAVSTSPWTLPSHTSLFTGRYPFETEADWRVPLGDTHPTLAERLGARGYTTAGFVGNILYCAAETGLARGFVEYHDYTFGLAAMVSLPSLSRNIIRKAIDDPFFFLMRNTAEQITDRFLDWLSERDGRPFFAFLNYFDAHGLYLVDAPYSTMFGPRSEFLYEYHNRGSWSPAEYQGFIDAYDGGLLSIDDQLARIVAELHRRGLSDDTLIVVTADHGEQFGEHGLKTHANSLYDPLLHVPLILRWPGRIPAGVRIADPVSLRDVPATVMDLLGGTPETALPGHSLAATWRVGATAPRSPRLAEVSKGINRPPNHRNSAGPMEAIYLDGLHYIKSGDGSEELYDLTADPEELVDLIGTRAADAARLRQELGRGLGR